MYVDNLKRLIIHDKSSNIKFIKDHMTEMLGEPWMSMADPVQVPEQEDRESWMSMSDPDLVPEQEDREP